MTYKFPLSYDSWNHEEPEAIYEVVKDGFFTMGKKVKKFEEEFSNYVDSKYSVMVNSGSSANLLALSSMNFKKGSEIITPSLTFSTTIAPIYQLGLVPYFIGVLENKFISDIDQIEKCINKKITLSLGTLQ